MYCNLISITVLTNRVWKLLIALFKVPNTGALTVLVTRWRFPLGPGRNIENFWVLKFKTKQIACFIMICCGLITVLYIKVWCILSKYPMFHRGFPKSSKKKNTAKLLWQTVVQRWQEVKVGTPLLRSWLILSSFLIYESIKILWVQSDHFGMHFLGIVHWNRWLIVQKLQFCKLWRHFQSARNRKITF